MSTINAPVTTSEASAEAPLQTPQEAPRERLDRHLRSNIPRHLLYVAAKLRLPDLLITRPHSTVELASILGAHAGTLRRVLRGMVSIGLLTESEDGTFALDDLGHLLRADAPEPFSGRLIRSVELQMAWGGLLNAVLTGDPPFHHVFGSDSFPHFARDPAVAALGAQANPGTSWEVAQAIAAAYDFSSFETVADVGGGDGTVLAAILQRHPHLTGTLLDQLHLVEDARQVAKHHDVLTRTQLIAGDFFEGVPPADVYLLKTILHDWDDARATRILRNCRQAMSPRGRVLVIELLVPERATAGAPFLGDIMMLVETGGRERTEPEYRTLFTAAGLTLTNILPLVAGRYAGRFLIEGTPANAG